jgi:hypothetical protein
MKSVVLATLVLAGGLGACSFGCVGVGRSYPPPPEGSYTVSTQQLGIGEAPPIPIETAAVSDDFFKAVGVAPILGRLFVPGDRSGGARVAVLTEDLWKEKFGGAPVIIGQNITLDGRRTVVIGVAPPGFSGPAGTRIFIPRE